MNRGPSPAPATDPSGARRGEKKNEPMKQNHSSGPALLELKGVTKVFGGLTAVDDVSFAIYFLVTGSVGMYDSTNFSPQSRIKLVNPNSFFGYTALFDNQFRFESVRAIEHCEVFALMRVDFLEMLKHSSRLANRILLAVSQSLLGDIRQTEEKYSSLTLQLARSNIVV